jgi:hypothetical protein
MHPSIDVLRDLARELRTLLSQLGQEAGGTWQASWGRCQVLFARYRADEPDLGTLPLEQAKALTDVLGEVVRLNAVAAGLVARETDALAQSVRGVTASRRRARGASAADGARLGASCDLSG